MSEKENVFKEFQKRISDHIEQAIKSLEDAENECFRSRIIKASNLAADEEKGIPAKINELREIKATVDSWLYLP